MSDHSPNPPLNGTRGASLNPGGGAPGGTPGGAVDGVAVSPAVNSAANLATNPLSRLDRVRIVLVETSHPGNIGAAARAIKVMGLSRLTLVAPLVPVDDQAHRRASGAADILERANIVATLDEALAGCAFAVAATARPRQLSPDVSDARTAALTLADTAAHAEVAIVFGNETSGLSNEHARRCQLLASIPAFPGYSSLNLAAAVQVFAYELRMALLSASDLVALTQPGGVIDVPAGLEEVERLVGHCETALAEIGFYDPANPKRLIPRLRRLFSRARLEREEVNILRGILNAATRPRG